MNPRVLRVEAFCPGCESRQVYFVKPGDPMEQLVACGDCGELYVLNVNWKWIPITDVKQIEVDIMTKV